MTTSLGAKVHIVIEMFYETALNSSHAHAYRVTRRTLFVPLFIRNYFRRNLHVEGQNIYRNYTTKKKELFDLKNFYNCKHQQLKSWFYSFTVNTRIDCLLFARQVFH